MIVYDSKLSIDHVIFDKNTDLRKIRQAFKAQFLLKLVINYICIQFITI